MGTVARAVPISRSKYNHQLTRRLDKLWLQGVPTCRLEETGCLQEWTELIADFRLPIVDLAGFLYFWLIRVWNGFPAINWFSG